LLKEAKLRLSHACLEDLDYSCRRLPRPGLDGLLEFDVIGHLPRGAESVPVPPANSR
jgi:hypothetical protein